MLVIIDTNIWISELGLNSAKGAAAKFYLYQNKAKVLLPEVIKLETEVNFIKHLNSYVKEISNNYRMLLAIFGELKEIVLPTEKEVEEKAKTIFDQFGIEIIEIPFSLNSARESFLKTINKLPPSGTNQQFKDGVIWADALSFLDQDDVFLVSADKAFYKNKEYKNGIAPELFKETKCYKNKLKLFHSITDLIEKIIIKIEIDNNDLVTNYYLSNKDKFDLTLERNKFELTDEFKIEIDCYTTLNPNEVFVNFIITYVIADKSDLERTDGQYILSGEAIYNPSDKQFYNFKRNGEKIISKGKDGKALESENIIIGVMDIVIGHKNVKHALNNNEIIGHDLI